MELKAFKEVPKEELSMIEVAHEILEERGEVIEFSDLVNQIQEYLGKADSEIRETLPQFYTDLNIDGSFISLGDNTWGLRSWYPIDSIDEELSHGIDDDDEEERPKKRKKKKVNAFLDMDEDAIDYNDDDPEDTDLADDDDEEYDDDRYLEDDEDEEDESKEIKEYDSELSEIGANDDVNEDDEEIVPEGVEDELTIIDDDDDDYNDSGEDNYDDGDER